MAQVTETKLPGIGVRYDFRTAGGTPVGVLVHRSGRRDLMVYSKKDSDATELTLGLDADDSRTLAELLGAARVAEGLAAVAQDIEGLTIDWIRIEPGADWAGMTLSEAAVHSTTGVSVVAIVVPTGPIVAPGANDVLAPGATAVAVGTRDGIEILSRRLRARES
jgi:TrkA domain protein